TGIAGRRGGGGTVRRPGGSADRLRWPARSEESPAQAPGGREMKPLVWKECRENLKWVGLPLLLILGPTALFGPYELMEEPGVFYAGLIAAVAGAGLGFLQFFPESSGDKRSLLLHRPLSPSQIFLGKVLAGVGLYLLGIGIPFGCAVALAATPGH